MCSSDLPHGPGIVARLGITIVYVTHDQSEALTMSDRIAVFNDGIIQQLAGPADLYEKPDNSFVAQFIGENNRISGRVVSVANGKARIDAKGGSFDALAVKCAAGQATSVSIRPERVIIDPSTADITFDARIEEVIYLGDHIRIRVEHKTSGPHRHTGLLGETPPIIHRR